MRVFRLPAALAHKLVCRGCSPANLASARCAMATQYERLAMTEPKIELGVKYLRYLGHIISHTEVFSDPKKVEAIHEMPAPQTKKDVRCWLGMCNY
jgi:hypothetical protein